MLRAHRLGWLLTIAAIAFASLPAHADNIQITLTQSSQTASGGTTLTFYATLANTTASSIFLNGDSHTTSSPGMIVLDNPFFTNAPLSLAGGATSGPFALFSVVVNPGTAPGTYLGTFDILGGATTTDLTTEGTSTFTVVVSPVPEPGTLMLLTTGVLALGLWKSRWVSR